MGLVDWPEGCDTPRERAQWAFMGDSVDCAQPVDISTPPEDVEELTAQFQAQDAALLEANENIQLQQQADLDDADPIPEAPPETVAPPDTDFEGRDYGDVAVQSETLGAFSGETVVVDTAAFNTFLAAIQPLPGMLTADEFLAATLVEPGTLPSASGLVSQLSGAAAPVTRSCIDSLNQFRDRLRVLHEDLTQTVARYGTTHANVEMEAQDLDTYFQKALGVQTGAGTPATPPAA